MLGTVAVGSLRAADESWPMFGENAANTASTSETTITTSKVSTLKTKWVFTTGGDVSARAAVVDGVVYFPDWGGNIWAVNASTGKKIWHHKMSDYGLTSGTVSRTSPAVVDGKVYIGTQTDGWLLALNAKTGIPDLENSSHTVPVFPQDYRRGHRRR
jgi:polyvinyl alcohol dehydrogenase (cytochrome)